MGIVDERANDKRSHTVAIIVPVFGQEHYLTACLEALRHNTSRYELILVDNGTGYSMEADCVIRNRVNVGFAPACNVGASKSNQDILVFLNVDTEVQHDWLVRLLTAFDDSNVVMAGPRIVHPAGDLQTAGITTWHGIGHAGGAEIKEDLPTRDVDGVTGACLAIRRNVFVELGGFHEGYRNGYEDVDLCLSAREKAYRIRYIAESTIMHHESASGPERWAHAQDNVALMNERWGHR